jgi:hypothetical protein
MFHPKWFGEAPLTAPLPTRLSISPRIRELRTSFRKSDAGVVFYKKALRARWLTLEIKLALVRGQLRGYYCRQEAT